MLNYSCRYDVIDIDPYGLPSRLFPYVFGLIDDGLMFMTFPMLGVAQINKITIRHYQAFWGF
jgi:tRNA G26 N,N-dimethylase Trm1